MLISKALEGFLIELEGHPEVLPLGGDDGDRVRRHKTPPAKIPAPARIAFHGR